MVVKTLDDVAGRSRAWLKTPATVLSPSLDIEKLSPLLGASTVNLADDCRPSFDLWRLMYSPLTSSTIQGAPQPAMDNKSSFARCDFPEPFLPVMMLRPPSSPLASTLIGSPSLCPSLTGIFPPFIISLLTA